MALLVPSVINDMLCDACPALTSKQQTPSLAT
jgi:hypothetical protein